MGFGQEIETIDFGFPFSWIDVLERLNKEEHFRLPTIEEAILIDFDYQAIWISNIIGKHRCVMDKDWGCRIVTPITEAGLVLVEK